MIGYAALTVAGLHSASDSQEHDLGARLAAGDREAFVATYRMHFAEVRAFAERLLGCRLAAEDLVHDVFLDLPAAFRRFRGQCSVKSFILSIAVNSASNHLRSAQRRRRLTAHGLEVLTPSALPGPDASTEQQQLGRLLTAALDALPLDQRVAFVLCEVEERSSSEVAAILGEKDTTIRARVFHAKKKLRQELHALAPSSAARKGKS